MDGQKVKVGSEDPLASLPPEMIQYGVILVQKFGDDSGGHMRWRNWDDAAKFGEGMVREGNALGFRVFKEAAI